MPEPTAATPAVDNDPKRKKEIGHQREASHQSDRGDSTPTHLLSPAIVPLSGLNLHSEKALTQ